METTHYALNVNANLPRRHWIILSGKKLKSKEDRFQTERKQKSNRFKEKIFLFRALFIEILRTVHWSGIFHLVNLFSTLNKLPECAMKFLHNDHSSSYNELCLKSDECTKLISCHRALCNIQNFIKIKPTIYAKNCLNYGNHAILYEIRIT